MTGYQKLKKELFEYEVANNQYRYERDILWEACMKIAQLKGPDLDKAPDIALIAMARSHEKA